MKFIIENHLEFIDRTVTAIWASASPTVPDRANRVLKWPSLPIQSKKAINMNNLQNNKK
jgi:hypothetical protein